MKRPVVYAHRGASGYAIENTIPSFQLAIKMKADAVEFDVQLTSDGGVVVFHDFTLGRLFNTDKSVSALKMDEIRQYTFHDTADGKPVNIPILEELLAVIGHKIAMNIELKSQSPDPSVLYRLCEEVFRLIKKHSLMKEVIVSSFNIDAVKQMRNLSNDVKVALLVDELSPEIPVYGHDRADSLVNPRPKPRLGTPPPLVKGGEGGFEVSSPPFSKGLHTLSFYIETAKGLSADTINMSYLLADSAVISKVHDSGLRLNVYTVNDEELLKTLTDTGVDGFFTNYPDVALKVIAQETARSAGR